MNKNENLLKENIMHDGDFRRKCHEYGVKWDDFSIGERYGNEPLSIIVNTPNKDVYIIMDEKYNVIGVHRFDSNETNRSLYNTTCNLRKMYNCVYVLYNLTIGDIVELANRVNLTIRNNTGSLRMLVNGENVNMDYGKTYIELLSYVKFLGKKIEEYYRNLYKAKILGLEYPSIISYVMGIINNIDDCVNRCIEEGRRPWPMDILNCIGDNADLIDQYNYALYEVIDLLLNEKGYKASNGFENYMKIETSDREQSDLFDKSDDLRAILTIPKSVMKERLKKANLTLEFDDINLEEFIAGDEKRK